MIQTKKVKEVDSNLANSIINQLCATKSIGRNSALSVKTIRACKLLLISTCNHAIKMGIMDENPFNEIHISDPHDFKKRPKKYADWTYETMIQIFDACKEEKALRYYADRICNRNECNRCSWSSLERFLS